MTDRAKRRRGITAAELIAELQADDEYQARSAARAAELEERAQAWRRAERPIVTELSEVGIAVESIWDLVNTSEPYPQALPVLISHLESSAYPDRVLEGLGRALAVGPSVGIWDRLLAVYRDGTSAGASTGAAVALAASATPLQVPDLIALLSLDQRADRIFFLRPILRHGGRPGRELLQSVRNDDVLGRQAGALLKEDTSRPTPRLTSVP